MLLEQWRSFTDEFVHNHKRVYDEDTDLRYTARSRIDLVGNTAVALAGNVTTGERRLRLMEQILEHGPENRTEDDLWGRHYFERWFHAKCVIALARLLVGKDWSAVCADIISRRGWTQVTNLVLGMAPRRFGKSVSVAKVFAVLVYVMLTMREGLGLNEYNVAVFSTGKRASVLLMQYAVRFLMDLGLGGLITRQNQEDLWLEIGTPGTADYLIIKARFLPASVDK